MASTSLKQLNTFSLDATANELIAIESIGQLEALLPINEPHLVLGGGSNMLFCENYQGIVLHNKLSGIEHEQDDEYHYFRVAGGESWHQFVMQTAAQGIGGLENLALIPGSVGAAPVQNIGAYGAELADVCFEVVAYDLKKNQRLVFTNEQCRFAYRDSIFKANRHYFITQVTFKLMKQWQPKLDYGELRLWSSTLETPPTPHDVALEVIAVRNNKLPDPMILPNVGSFFKNPIVSLAQAQSLKLRYNQMPQYPTTQGVKLAAGWLIDQLGFKGKTVGGAAVHEQQALVLVNQGDALSSDVTTLAGQVITAVELAFGVQLEPEVNMINKNGYCQLASWLTKERYV